MKNIELQLDEKTLEKAQALAKSRHCDLSELIAYAIDQLPKAEPEKYPLLGLFADDPESVDEMLEEVMKDRAAHPLNQRFGKGIT
ncbi:MULTISPECIES: hypothetical protein [unclassified Tolypothrix]|uniref:hypothetical protein n=1 Tax=unclassified Tolypothrix TaxID=2649714 RepID=UPI0005EABCEE|nr:MULTISPECIES: hypothetical protein [unclassified Tolypothrix]BAY92816.1 hypothetical protein NIES3275_48530 [Microchaete diplosiphon NIES-3275]EKF04112.1 hypothetical protein FDUTEX481_02811 [Tolypothrix sp. PCC 7601]MBE9087905.1 hypothetical protein [Tolypothrix sp. LEGE 11397]QIR38231.1 hypothetical protein HCG51_16965 [Tolypothrix sp. PCC 7910]UYD26734.1 hypothetical protein HGR01_01020 [Tolypothrix sp. PCC 7712]